MGVAVIRRVAAEDLQSVSDLLARVGDRQASHSMPQATSHLIVDVTGRSTHTLPRLGLDTVCIHNQKSKIAESVPKAARVVICWPEVVFEELVYLLYRAVEEWHRHIFFSSYIGFYFLNNVRR